MQILQVEGNKTGDLANTQWRVVAICVHLLRTSYLLSDDRQQLSALRRRRHRRQRSYMSTAGTKWSFHALSRILFRRGR